MCAFANNIMNRELNLILLGIEENSEVNFKASPVRPIYGFDEKEIEGAENLIKSLIPLIKPNPHFDITHTYIDNRAFIIIAFYNNNNGPYEVSADAENTKGVNLKRGRYVRIERETKLATVF